MRKLGRLVIGLDPLGHKAGNASVLGSSEKLVTVSSLLNSPVSTITGRICPLFPSSELAVTGKTNDPSELAWSLITP